MASRLRCLAAEAEGVEDVGPSAAHSQGLPCGAREAQRDRSTTRKRCGEPWTRACVSDAAHSDLCSWCCLQLEARFKLWREKRERFLTGGAGEMETTPRGTHAIVHLHAITHRGPPDTTPRGTSVRPTARVQWRCHYQCADSCCDPCCDSCCDSWRCFCCSECSPCTRATTTQHCWIASGTCSCGGLTVPADSGWATVAAVAPLPPSMRSPQSPFDKCQWVGATPPRCLRGATCCTCGGAPLKVRAAYITAPR
jgi:hypothetical protein